MIIDLRAVSGRPRSFDIHLEPEWWKGDEDFDPVLGLDGPLQGRIVLANAGAQFVLEGDIKGGLKLQCDRCLEPFHHNLESRFRLFLALPPSDVAEGEVELEEGDLSVDFIVGDEIDVDAIIAEQVYLSLPMKTLCRDDCAGLCPGCGVNLNLETCDCRRQEGHPGLQKLKNVKFDDK